MSSKDDDGAADIAGLCHPAGNVQGKHRQHIVRGADRRRNARTIIDDQTAVLDRENLATARENAADQREDTAHLREDTAHLREAAATTREQVIHAAEATQAATDDHMMQLQQANAHLVVASIEAQKLTEKIELAQIDLENAKLAAEKANLAKSSFISSMSHELRTPLNAILGFAQLLEAGTPPPTDVQMIRLHQIIKAGWYLLELINEILDLAGIESGKQALARESLLLIDVVRECQIMIEPQAQQRGIRIDFIPCDDTLFVNADRIRLKQVLINLLSNAIKYNREHGTVEVVCSAKTAEHIYISVKDSGIGIPPEKLAQLFQPFNRLGQENGVEQGTGIGLVVTKQLTELMGGTIGVESTVGEGSEFWIELIRDVGTTVIVGQTVPTEIIQSQIDAALRTLLYVEDNPANLMLVEQMIESHPQLRMLSARNGELGIALAGLHLPDVILMDINLPGISGVQALQFLRENPVTAHIPVIALSANAMRHDIEQGLESGFFRYLTKPIKINELMDTLNMALRLPKTEFGDAVDCELPK